MNKVIAESIKKHVLNYRELGEAPVLRRINGQAKATKHAIKLDIACEYLASLMQRPELVRNYEQKMYRR